MEPTAEITLTLRLPLRVDDAARRLLDEVDARYTASYNRVATHGWDANVRSSIDLHRDTYYDEREASGLPSQLVISARMRAHESLESVRDRKRKGKKASCPHSHSAGVRYDARSATIRLSERYGTFATLPGLKRLRLSFSVPEVCKPYLEWQTGSAEIVRNRKGQYTLHIVVKKTIERPPLTDQVVGADLGVSRPAVTSQNLFYGEKRWKEIERRYLNQKKSLQAKGTKSAKRKLKKLSGRLERFRQDCDHVISKRITDAVDAGGVLVLEDLTDIRDRMRAGTAEHRRRLHGWSFARIQTFVSYKALRRQAYALWVDPAYTSQTCSRCGHCERANRRSRSIFRCKACSFECNADLNASRNLEQRGRAVIASGELGGPPSTGPHVSQSRKVA